MFKFQVASFRVIVYTDRQTDNQTHRQTDRQTDRQTQTCKYIGLHGRKLSQVYISKLHSDNMLMNFYPVSNFKTAQIPLEAAVIGSKSSVQSFMQYQSLFK